MDQNVLSTCIVAGTNIFTCILGLTIGKIEFSNSKSKKLLNSQLEHLYLPLAQIFDVETASYCSFKDDISNTIRQGLLYAPQELLISYKDLRDNATEKNYDDFRTLTLRLYNQAKKELGYPYDLSLISEGKQQERPNSLRRALSFVLSAASLLLLALSGTDSERISLYAIISSAILVVAMTMLLPSMASYYRNKRKEK